MQSADQPMISPAELLYHVPGYSKRGFGSLFRSPADLALMIRKAKGRHYKGTSLDSLANFLKQSVPDFGEAIRPLTARMKESILAAAKDILDDTEWRQFAIRFQEAA